MGEKSANVKTVKNIKKRSISLIYFVMSLIIYSNDFSYTRI